MLCCGMVEYGTVLIAATGKGYVVNGQVEYSSGIVK
jgi:hypothetical protein